jgi:SAM-dependent methyltransferase
MLSVEQSHAQSLIALNTLNRYQDFMNNLAVVADMGCGFGLDAAWWANLTKDDGTPRNIKVNAIDINLDPNAVAKHPNINYIAADFNVTGLESNSQDFVLSHMSLQYSISPIHTLLHWWSVMKPEAMLMITLPYNYNINEHKEILNVNAKYSNGCFFNWTLGNLIMMLAATGFDCRNSHFKFDKINGYIQAAVYKLETEPTPAMNWYEMCDRHMLPVCIEESIMQNGTFDDVDIVCDWIDRSQYILRM